MANRNLVLSFFLHPDSTPFSAVTALWTIDLEPSKRILEQALSELHGVEHVHMSRYSAHITYAPHATSWNALQESVVETFHRLKDTLKVDQVFPPQSDLLKVTL